uniref:FunU14 n=1 Tax=Streptosporangium sp. KD35 TaxID=2162663 RepID=A0A2U9KCV5_9ACTN|nr:FunU14 [Streptosporangium sp. KD35]
MVPVGVVDAVGGDQADVRRPLHRGGDLLRGLVTRDHAGPGGEFAVRPDLELHRPVLDRRLVDLVVDPAEELDRGAPAAHVELDIRGGVATEALGVHRALDGEGAAVGGAAVAVAPVPLDGPEVVGHHGPRQVTQVGRPRGGSPARQDVGAGGDLGPALPGDPAADLVGGQLPVGGRSDLPRRLEDVTGREVLRGGGGDGLRLPSVGRGQRDGGLVDLVGATGVDDPGDDPVGPAGFEDRRPVVPEERGRVDLERHRGRGIGPSTSADPVHHHAVRGHGRADVSLGQGDGAGPQVLDPVLRRGGQPEPSGRRGDGRVAVALVEQHHRVVAVPERFVDDVVPAVGAGVVALHPQGVLVDGDHLGVADDVAVQLGHVGLSDQRGRHDGPEAELGLVLPGRHAAPAGLEQVRVVPAARPGVLTAQHVVLPGGHHAPVGVGQRGGHDVGTPGGGDLPAPEPRDGAAVLVVHRERDRVAERVAHRRVERLGDLLDVLAGEVRGRDRAPVVFEVVDAPARDLRPVGRLVPVGARTAAGAGGGAGRVAEPEFEALAVDVVGECLDPAGETGGVGDEAVLLVPLPGEPATIDDHVSVARRGQAVAGQRVGGVLDRRLGDVAGEHTAVPAHGRGADGWGRGPGLSRGGDRDGERAEEDRQGGGRSAIHGGGLRQAGFRVGLPGSMTKEPEVYAGAYGSET